jgi:hypothetical protein
MNNFSGMTVNERLFAAGRIDDFDKAMEERNRAEAIRILQEVELSATEAESTMAAIENNPGKYGYPR